MKPTETDFKILKQLELELWVAETRFNRQYMEGLFAPDLFEFGRSGRVYSRDQLLAATGAEINARLPLENMEIRLISERVAQVTYNSYVEYDGVTEKARRSSIWSLTNKGWELRFHQGTPFE